MDYLYPLVMCFVISFFSIRLIKPLAIKTGLVDIPTKRKQHKGRIPLVGGIGIYISILLSILVFIENTRNINIYLACAALVLFLGALDDKYDLSARVKFVGQSLIAAILVIGTEQTFNSLGYIFGPFEFNLGPFAIIFTVFAVVAGINALNMMDGIDGLAGSLSLVAFISLAFLFNFSSAIMLLICLLFVTALLAYLMFNLRLHKSLTKVFLGDAGNMFLGLSLLWLFTLGVNLPETTFRPVVILYLGAIPLADMIAIIIRRLKKGQSPFKADREHLHHIFQRAGVSDKLSLVTITLVASIIALIGCYCEIKGVAEWKMFIGFIIMFAIYNFSILHIWKLVSKVRRISLKKVAK